MMSLWSNGISKGDEVITSPISFIASSNSILHVGAKPVFVDVGEDLNINPNLIERAITKKLKLYFLFIGQEEWQIWTKF